MRSRSPWHFEEVLAEAYPRVSAAHKVGDRLLAEWQCACTGAGMTETEEKDGWVRMCTSEGSFAGVLRVGR